MTLTLYTNPMSRGRIAHWMMEEVGAPYEVQWTTFGPNGHKSPAYLAINPMGKLPALVHDGAVVTEAAAIVMYMAAAFPEAELGPRPEERANYYRWLLFAAGPLEQAQTAGALGWEVPDGQAGMVGFGSAQAVTQALEQHLANNTWICGERFTAADVYVGSSVGWALMRGGLPKNPAFTDYAARVQARPAMQRVREQCDAYTAQANKPA